MRSLEETGGAAVGRCLEVLGVVGLVGGSGFGREAFVMIATVPVLFLGVRMMSDGLVVGWGGVVGWGLVVDWGLVVCWGIMVG